MKLSLLNRLVCPPEPFFRYVFPEDGYQAVATTFDGWMTQALLHAQANGLEAPSPVDMEDQLCKTLPPGWCNYASGNRIRPSTALDWSAVSQGLKVFSGWIVQGRATVKQAEADRRALICSRCYLNVHISGCSGCQRLVADVLTGKSCKYDFALRGCAVCKCVLKAKIHFPLSLLDTQSGKMQSMYPDFCWLKKGGDNYRALNGEEKDAY